MVNKINEGQKYSIDLLWLALLIFMVLSTALYQVIQPNDYWWYVRVGQEIFQQGYIHTIETFSYTQAGQPVVYHSWLAAVIFAGVYEMGSLIATLLLRGLLVVVFYVALWFTCREAGLASPVTSLLLILSALAGLNNWAMRPQLFAYPLFGLALLILWRWHYGKHRGVWLLPVLMLIWVNVHGSFVLGFLLVGAAFVGGGGERKLLFWSLVGMSVASLINPRGWEAWSYVLTLLTDNSSQQFSTEWRPPTNATWIESIFFVWLLFFPLLLALSPRKLTPTHWLWFLGYGWLALSGIRYVIWFMAVVVTLTAYLLAPLVNPYVNKPTAVVRPKLNGVIIAFLLLLPLLMLPGVRHLFWAEAPPALAENTPVAASQWLAERVDELPGPLWTDLAFASYHVFALPEYPVWIDTRFEVYPTEHWERYVDLTTAVPNWATLLDEEGINLLMLDPDKQPRLIQALEEQQPAQWELCYQDEVASLYVRLTEGQRPSICQPALFAE